VIAEMRRVTRRGGRVLAVEADWETAMVHPGERGGHQAPSSTTPPTAISTRGSAGGCRPVRRPGVRRGGVETFVTVDEGGEDRAWLEFLFERAALAVSAGVVEREEAVRWMAGLDEGFNTDNFFFGLTQFAVLGRVPM
jgi:hypothetical protein